VLEFVHPDDHQGHLDKCYSLLSRETDTCRHMVRYITRSGAIRWIEARARIVTDMQGEIVGIAGLLNDLTERKNWEDALSQAHAQALETSRLKSDFLAMMSHEIRTPMSGIIGMTELLMETDLDADQREFASIAHDSAHTLLTVLNDILDFSRIEAGKLTLNHTDFALIEVLEHAAAQFHERANAKQITLQTFVAPEIPSHMQGDPYRLRQVLTNLISNAIKFTDKGEVVVRAIPEELTAEHVTINFTVHDTGIGISEETRRQLFQPFTQADSSATRRYGGTGLGLAISQRLVAMMHGEIDVESAEGIGSVFWFTARFERSHLALVDHIEDADDDESGPGLRVLVADENKTSRSMLHRMLLNFDLRASAVGSGREALDSLRAAAPHHPYDLALIDLPTGDNMDSFALAHAIREDAVIANTCLILISDAAPAQSDNHAQDDGFALRLTRPIQQASLRDMLSTTFDSYAATYTPAAWPLPNEHPPILLIDDNPVSQRITLRQIERLGYAVQPVATGHEALPLLDTGTYALIIFGCQIPSSDGFLAPSSIRQHLRATERNMPILVLAAELPASNGNAGSLFADDVDDIISRPVNLDTMHAILRRWLAPSSPSMDEG
jgi:signal transduction histidine kinase/CheY-like chemotaxis protein